MKPCELGELPKDRAEALGRVAPGVLHDLNNLLTVVLAAVDLIEAEAPQVESLTSTIREAVARGITMHRQLLAYARRGELETPQSVEVSAAVRDLSAVLDMLAGPTVRIDYALQTRQSYVAVCRGALDQVLINLVANARDAMPSGGHIDIVVSEAAEQGSRTVILDVADEGVGMTPDVIARIFDPFFTTKSAEDGSGLGLHVVRGVVEAAGGRIDVTSVPDAGSRFRVTFPAVLRAVAIT
jgi:two-component system, cell cycle sensor histidine kinase and response regulator CckA